MDDDIKLYITKEESKSQNPWRAIEYSLKSLEPAVGVVHELIYLMKHMSIYQQYTLIQHSVHFITRQYNISYHTQPDLTTLPGGIVSMA